MSGLSTHTSGPVLGRWEKPLEMLLGSATALILACIMVLTCLDVAGRYLLTMPVPGALEATELMMGALIFASLPLVTLRNQQVTIDIFASLIPKAVKRPLQVFIQIVGSICLGVIAWRLWIKGGQVMDYGDTTAVLRISVWPLVYFMSVLSAVTASILLIMIRHNETTGESAGGAGEV